MQLVVSKKMKQENELLGEFLRKLESTKTSMVELAHAYKACVDAGIDLGRHVGRGMALRLIGLAEGKLLPEVGNRLLGNDAMTSVMAALPVDTQKTLLERGVEIGRGGEVKTVPIDDVRSSEARRLLDLAAGRARVLSGQEQLDRRVPIPPRTDKIVELRVTPKEMTDLNAAAHKAGQSVAHYIKRQLYLSGIISTKAKRPPARGNDNNG